MKLDQVGQVWHGISTVLTISEPGATGGYSPTNEGQDSDNSSLDDDDDIDSDDERFKSDRLEEVHSLL